MSFRALVITLFPQLFPGPLGESLAGKALARGDWQLETLNLRDYGMGRHNTVDDTPYGGGAGMVLRPDVVDAAFTEARTRLPQSRLIYLSPRGRTLTQPLAAELAQQDLILLCGRYEGVDQRVLDAHDVEEISIGDYVLSGGELAALVVLDTCLRLLPGVMGHEASAEEESFGIHADYAGLLEYPHYTKPPFWNGLSVPETLLSGHHGRISAWRKEQAEKITRARRPDLWQRYRDRTDQK